MTRTLCDIKRTAGSQMLDTLILQKKGVNVFFDSASG